MEGLVFAILQGIDTTGWERFGAYAGMIFIFTMFLRYFATRMDKHTEAITILTEEIKGLAVALQGRPCMTGDK